MTGEIEILFITYDVPGLELTVGELRSHRLANRIEVLQEGPAALDFLFCRGSYAQRSFTSPPKLILFDLNLPNTEGIDVLREMRRDKRTSFIPVVVLTSSKEQRDIVEGYKLAVDAYIQKPFSFTDFGKAIEQIGLFWLAVNPQSSQEVFPS